jgi:hypothetical protein
MGMQCATDETSLVSVAPPATTTTALSSADMAGVRAGIDLDVEKELGYAYEGAADAGAVVVQFPLVTRRLSAAAQSGPVHGDVALHALPHRRFSARSTP